MLVAGAVCIRRLIYHIQYPNFRNISWGNFSQIGVPKARRMKTG